jgi:hypothetical protein
VIILLRPEFNAISSTGLFLRPNGILGAGLLPHDSANLLAMFSVFWLSLSFHARKGNFIAFFFAIIYIVTLLLTQSASNIIAVFVGFLSLWHYGSVLRTTNIFVFFSMYGQVINMDAMAKLQNTYA